MGRKCFVPFCRTGYVENGEVVGKGIRMFGSPLDPGLLSKWRRNIPRVDRQLSSDDFVCELHFGKNMIQTTKTLVVDGKEVILPLSRSILVPGAVPTIFPTLRQLSSPSKERKGSLKCYPAAVKMRNRMPLKDTEVPSVTTDRPKDLLERDDVDVTSEGVFAEVTGCVTDTDRSRVQVPSEEATEETIKRREELNLSINDPGNPGKEEVEEMVTCCAFGCSNSTNNKPVGITFHKFPIDPKLRKKWTYAVRRKNWTPSPRSALCSAHFRERLFDRTSLCVVRLREGAVPDIFPAIESILSKAMKRKADDDISVPISKPNLQNTNRDPSEVLSSEASDIEERNPKTRALQVSKQSGAAIQLSEGESSNTESATVKPPTEDAKPKAYGPGQKRTARKSTATAQIQRKTLRPLTDEPKGDSDQTDGLSDKSMELPQVRLSTKSSQTNVTLQQACKDMIQLQREIMTLRRQLELARDDNKRLLTRLNLLRPITSRPGDIVVPKTTKTLVKGNQVAGRASDVNRPTDPNDIWDANEVQIVPTGDDVITDPRHRPAVNVVYKQKVGSEDLFLQVGRKTPMTSSCESMIITLTMKGETMKDIDCNITEKFLDIRSPLYRFHMPFPNTVNPDTAEAEWNTPASQLIITVDLVRELDAVNF